jgi:hypothetical protein
MEASHDGWQKFQAVAVVGVILLVLGIIGSVVLRNAHGASGASLAFRVIEYKHDGPKQDTVKVVYDHRRIMNLDRNVTELQTKLGSAGWVPAGEHFTKADVVPKGCVIRVLVPEKEQVAAPQSKYALEGCDPSMTVSSVMSPPHIIGNVLGHHGHYRLIAQSR